MCESAERKQRMRKRLKENDELYHELKEKERKQQNIIRDQKKTDRVQGNVKLKQYREYERKAKQRKKKIAEQDGVEQNGRKTSGERTRRTKFSHEGCKMTNHNRRFSRKLKKKDITYSSPILSITIIETPQASTSNSEVE